MADYNPTHLGHERHGSHSYTWKIVSVGPRSTVTMLICDTCHFIRTECNHDGMTWTDTGTTLICDFCGIDGT